MLAQTDEDFELVVVDDGSADATPRLGRVGSRTRPRGRLIGQENQGTAGARNTGIGAARRHVISFLDHDDLWLPDIPRADGGSPWGARPTRASPTPTPGSLDDRLGRSRRITSFETPARRPAADAHEQLCGSCVANYIMSSATVRADVLEDVGGFDTDIQGTDDWDLWLRILATAGAAVPARGCLLISRDHVRPSSRPDLAMMLRNDERVIAKLASARTLPDEVRAAAAEKLAEIRRRLSPP